MVPVRTHQVGNEINYLPKLHLLAIELEENPSLQ